MASPQDDDFFQPLLFPNKVEALVICLLNIPVFISLAWVAFLKYQYIAHVQRYTTLLTKLHGCLLQTFPFLLPTGVMFIFRWGTGLTLPVWLCQTIQYWDTFALQTSMALVTIEAFSHWIFLARQHGNTFLILKEDLICKITMRCVLGIGVLNSLAMLFNRHEMPTSYYICCGKNPRLDKLPVSNHCDDFIKIYETAVFALYTIVFFTSSILVLIEKKRTTRLLTETSAARNIEQCSLKEDKTRFLFKVVHAIQICVLTKIYNDMDPEKMIEYPGALLIYYYNTIMNMLAISFIFCLNIKNDLVLRSYMLRRFGVVGVLNRNRT